MKEAVLSSGRVGSGPGGGGEGLGARSRDRQEIHTCGGSSLGFVGLDQGVSTWCSYLATAKTQKQKPENPRLFMLLVCPIEITNEGGARNHQHPANQTQIITDVADWAALWYPRTGKFLNACFRTEPQAYRALLCAGIFKMPDASCQRYSVTSAQRACDEGLDARHVAVRR